jgi:cytochrome P450 family 135
VSAAAVEPVPRLPPGSRLPPLAQTVAAIGSPESFITGLRRAHGDVFTLRLVGAPPFVLICDPQLIREVFTGPADTLRAGEANAPLAPLLGPRSVLTLDGEAHLRERRRLLPAFHGARLVAYERIMERATLREVEGWPVGRPFALLPSMQEITLEVIMRAVLGVAAGERYEELAERIRRVLTPEGGRVTQVIRFTGAETPLDRRFAARVAAVDEVVFAEIADRRADPRLDEREDVLSELLRGGLTDEELRDEVITLLVAGHETTAVGLSWTFERVLRHPEVLARLPEDEAYLDATIKEALRARPVLPSVGRVLAAPYAVGEHLLPAGTLVVPSIVLTHMREDLYPDHERFDPERFLGPDAPGTYEWLPFGGGVRRCLGASFALLEMRVVVRTVLRRATLEADRPEDEPPDRSSITIAPGRGARVVRRA